MDTSGELADGTKLNGPDDLRNALVRNPEQDNRGRTPLDYAKGNTGGRGQAPAANPETAALLEKLAAKRP